MNKILFIFFVVLLAVAAEISFFPALLGFQVDFVLVLAIIWFLGRDLENHFFVGTIETKNIYG